MSNDIPNSSGEIVPQREIHADNPAHGSAKPIFDSQALFQGEREVLIQHGQERYRLILTKANKLILQK